MSSQHPSSNQIVALGKILSGPTRVALLDALSDGRAYTVSELRSHVRVAASTASEHLGRLLRADLVGLEPHGRHRYYRLKGPEVAEMLESLWHLGRSIPVERSRPVPGDLALARSCYDHLAGAIAVGLTEALNRMGAIEFVDLDPRLTETGASFFSQFDLAEPPSSSRRPAVRRCLDWSERKPHLGGALPAQFLDFMLREKWFVRKGSSRALRITEAGRAGLEEAFGYLAPASTRDSRTR